MPRSNRQLWTAKLSGKPVAAAKPDPGENVAPGFTGVVLGVDPSLRGTGLALVDFSAGPDSGKLLGSRTLRLKPKLSQSECLGEIHRTISSLITRYQPHCLALEESIYVQNFQTALVLGMARGAAIAQAASEGLPIHNYAPRRIKQAVVGTGSASKSQVAAMVRQHLKIASELPFDESDAAAVALCHAFTGHKI